MRHSERDEQKGKSGSGIDQELWSVMVAIEAFEGSEDAISEALDVPGEESIDVCAIATQCATFEHGVSIAVLGDLVAIDEGTGHDHAWLDDLVASEDEVPADAVFGSPGVALNSSWLGELRLGLVPYGVGVLPRRTCRHLSRRSMRIRSLGRDGQNGRRK